MSSRWTAVSRALDEQLQRSRAVLQVWEIYARLAASFSERLQKLQSDVEAELSRAPTDDNTVEQIAVKIHNVQVKQLKHRKRISFSSVCRISPPAWTISCHVPCFAE